MPSPPGGRLRAAAGAHPAAGGAAAPPARRGARDAPVPADVGTRRAIDDAWTSDGTQTESDHR